jgi:hypothetical protein
MMSKLDFLEEYRKLVEKSDYYIDTGYCKPLYVMEKLYPVDDCFENTMDKLMEDIGE